MNVKNERTLHTDIQIFSIRRVQKLKDGDLNQCIKLTLETFLNIDDQNELGVSF